MRVGDSESGMKEVANSPFAITIHPGLAVNGSACYVQGPCLESGGGGNNGGCLLTAAASYAVTLTAVDYYGNRLQAPASNLGEVKAMDVLSNKPIDIEGLQYNSSAPGTYSLSYKWPWAGDIQVRFSVQNKPTADGVHDITVTPAPVSAASSSATFQTVALETNQRGSFNLSLADAFHNEITNFNPAAVHITTYMGRIDAGASASNVSVTCKATECQFVPVVAGKYSLGVLVNKQHIDGSPFTLDVNWGGLSNGTVILVGGVLVGVLLLGVGIFVFLRKRKEKQFYRL